jgi:hypothetical protein
MRNNYKKLTKTEFEKIKRKCIGEISLCNFCGCMTKTVFQNKSLLCGKCGGLK